MAQYSAISTLVTPGGTITFNTGSGDYYFVDPDQSSGLDMAPVRMQVEDKPQTSGGIVHAGFKGARHVVLAGVLVAATDAGRTALEDALNAALASILTADGTLTYTPAGASARHLTVRCDVAATYPGAQQKRFIFGLVAANPDFT